MINGINPFYMDYNSYEMKQKTPLREAVSDEDREKRANASEDELLKLDSASSLIAVFSKDLGMTFGSSKANTSNATSSNNATSSTTTVTQSGDNKTVTTITPINITYGNSTGLTGDEKQKVSDIISQFFKTSSFANKYDKLLEKFGLKLATTNNSNKADTSDTTDQTDNSASVNKDINSGLTQEELNAIVTKKKVA